MLAHFEESGIVYGESTVHASQEAACRTDLLYDEMSDVSHHLGIVCGQDGIVRSVAQGNGYEI